MEDSRVPFGAERLGRRRFLVRTSAGVLTLSALDAMLGERARVHAQTPPENCPDLGGDLQSLIDTVDAQIAANCPSGNRLDCSSLLTPSQLSSFAAQRSALDALSTEFSCDSTSTDAELAALSNLQTDSPEFLGIVYQYGSSPRALVCSAVPGIPTLHPFGLLTLGGALLGLSAWWLHRRKVALDPRIGMTVAAAGGGLLLAEAGNAQSVQLVDLLEQSLGNRCLARLLAIFFQVVVPVQEAIDLAAGITQAMQDPEVAAEINGMIASLQAVNSILTNFSVSGCVDELTGVFERLTRLLGVMLRKGHVIGPSRAFLDACTKRTVKCFGLALLLVDITRGYIDGWGLVRADCNFK